MEKSLNIAFQADKFSTFNPKTDSTYRLALEAQRRGHKVFHYEPENLIFCENRLLATGNFVRLEPESFPAFVFTSAETIELASIDVLWLRQDPPFDMGYLTTTYLLDLLPRTVQVVNNPFWVRNSPEKLLVLQFPDLIPPTLISRNYNAIQKFRKKHGDIVIKPLYGNGGIGVFRISQNDSNLAALCEMFFNNSREPLIAQKFLMDVFEGDKRIVLFDGEPVGALNRRPPEGEIRSNMHVGGEIQTAQLTENEISICKKIEPTLRQKGFIFVGIDVIGNYLTEINVTSPTGIQEIEHFETVNLAEKIWLILEKKHALHKN